VSFGPDRVLLILERRIILEKVHSISHRSTEKDSRNTRRVFAGFTVQVRQDYRIIRDDNFLFSRFCLLTSRP
jgi:hypothetical protein